MIVLGLLSYHNGYLKIPNRELMKEFEKSLRDESFGYVSEIIENSRKMLKDFSFHPIREIKYLF